MLKKSILRNTMGTVNVFRESSCDHGNSGPCRFTRGQLRAGCFKANPNETRLSPDHQVQFPGVYGYSQVWKIRMSNQKGAEDPAVCTRVCVPSTATCPARFFRRHATAQHCERADSAGSPARSAGSRRPCLPLCATGTSPRACRWGKPRLLRGPERTLERDPRGARATSRAEPKQPSFARQAAREHRGRPTASV